MHNRDWHYGMDGGGWWWMAIMMVVFWGGLIALAVAILRRPYQAAGTAAGGTNDSATRPSAQEILAERLARGEIETDEYRSRLDALSHRPGA
jgi:putative membrane protein